MRKCIILLLCVLLAGAGHVSPGFAVEPAKTPIAESEALALESAGNSTIDSIVAGQDVDTALLVVGLLVLLGIGLAVGLSVK